MYFPRGGATIKGDQQARARSSGAAIYVEGDALHMDIGRGGALRLPDEETAAALGGRPRPQWPMMHAVLYGVTRDQFMAKHQANHIQVVYAPDAPTARAPARRQGRHGRGARHPGESVRRYRR